MEKKCKEIALATLEKKVGEYNLLEMTYLVNGLIHRTHAECGYAVDEKNIDITIDLFVKDLMEYNRTMSFQEVELAFRNGYKNEYGEWFGLNNKTYFKWINGFVHSEERRRAILLREQTLNPPPKKYTDDEKKKILHEGSLRSFKEYKEKGFVLDIGNPTYDYLCSIGVISFTRKRKYVFIEEAQKTIKSEKLIEYESNFNKEKRKEIESVISSINNPKDTLVVSTAKRIGLNCFFKDLIDTGTELVDLINNK